MSQIIALVMAGGQGTRFWPESTSKKPKQYLSLLGDEPLLKQTLKRFEGLVAESNRYVVTVEAQEKLAKESGHGVMGDQALIFEPSGRNTAPCILLSLAKLLQKGHAKEDIVAIVPSDHVILNEQGFKDTISLAAQNAARDNAIVTIGINPHFPHTGFGYLHKGDAVDNDVYKVAEFKEKPNKDVAKDYVASGEYLWNAGMFVAKIETLLQEFEACSPETFEHYGSLCEANADSLSAVYDRVPANSIDYAVMEKSSRVHVVPAMFDWNDLGSWDALEDVIEKREDNTIVTCRDYYLDQAKGNIIYAPDKHVSVIGVDNLIVVSNEKTVVVLPKEQSQEVKSIVAHLKERDDLKDLL